MQSLLAPHLPLYSSSVPLLLLKSLFVSIVTYAVFDHTLPKKTYVLCRQHNAETFIESKLCSKLWHAVSDSLFECNVLVTTPFLRTNLTNTLQHYPDLYWLPIMLNLIFNSDCWAFTGNIRWQWQWRFVTWVNVTIFLSIIIAIYTVTLF